DGGGGADDVDDHAGRGRSGLARCEDDVDAHPLYARWLMPRDRLLRGASWAFWGPCLSGSGICESRFLNLGTSLARVDSPILEVSGGPEARGAPASGGAAVRRLCQRRERPRTVRLRIRMHEIVASAI